MSVYNKLCEKKNFNPQILNIIEIFFIKYRQKGEVRIKWNIKKMKNFLQNDIISKEDPNIYIVILVNNHAICCTDKYKFDPSFEYALPRTKICFKISAETDRYEDDRKCIRACYCLFRNPTKNKWKNTI